MKKICLFLFIAINMILYGAIKNEEKWDITPFTESIVRDIATMEPELENKVDFESFTEKEIREDC
ncbi:MAG: hypothetical protein LBT51_03080 [Fusobacteriaceae bacterium]|jgi:hypothetical protein|nr:hypothetical protein [Fusobacteriaceae bacterium]